MITLTRKGQVTLPKKIREYLGLRPGSGVAFSVGPNGEVIVKPKDDIPVRRHRDRYGKLRGTLDTGKSTDELMRLLRGYDEDPDDPGLRHDSR
jgi:AbrB family looped-hinge helix DNA binding protein